jgi:hypothetical protein
MGVSNGSGYDPFDTPAPHVDGDFASIHAGGQMQAP